MSASKQKRIRSNETQNMSPAAREKFNKDKKFRRNTVIVTVIVCLLAIATILSSSSIMYKYVPAVKVGSTNYSSAQFSYFYNAIVNNSGASYLRGNFDLVEYSDEQTYEEFFIEQTFDRMKNFTALYDSAIAAGYTLTAEERDEIDLVIADIAAVVADPSYGYTSVNHALSANFGRGMNEATYRNLIEMELIVSRYSQDILDGFVYTDAELDAYFEEHKDDFESFSYAYFNVSGYVNGLEEELDDEAKAEKTAEIAAAISEATNEVKFSELTMEHCETVADYGYTVGFELREEYKEWIIDSARTNGDTLVFDLVNGDGTNSTYVMMFIVRDGQSLDYNMVNVRHILIKAEPNENGEYTEEALATASAQIEEIYDLWEKNPTEEYFIELVGQYSEDGGSNLTGGLYEDITKGQMVSGFEAFCFAGNEPGDTGIVLGESGSYTGYHLIYFVSEGENYKDYVTKYGMATSYTSINGIATDDYDAYIESITVNYQPSAKFGLRFASTK